MKTNNYFLAGLLLILFNFTACSKGSDDVTPQSSALIEGNWEVHSVRFYHPTDESQDNVVYLADIKTYFDNNYDSVNGQFTEMHFQKEFVDMKIYLGKNKTRSLTGDWKYDPSTKNINLVFGSSGIMNFTLDNVSSELLNIYSANAESGKKEVGYKFRKLVKIDGL